MKAEQAKRVADQALEQLSQALAAGRSEELTRYLSVLAKFHKYSFGNVMLILSQKPDATHVAGFNTWKQMGRYVRQGEKGIVIIAPMIFRKQEDVEETGKQYIDKYRSIYSGRAWQPLVTEQYVNNALDIKAVHIAVPVNICGRRAAARAGTDNERGGSAG